MDQIIPKFCEIRRGSGTGANDAEWSASTALASLLAKSIPHPNKKEQKMCEEQMDTLHIPISIVQKTLVGELVIFLTFCGR